MYHYETICLFGNFLEKYEDGSSNNLFSKFYVIHTVHALTINVSSNMCTLWYTIYDIC